jgi:RNA polymerase sigma-70 factor (ECF subfamily)
VIAAPTREEAMAGEQGAFMVLVEPLLPAAYRLATAMLHSDTDAEDAVQEAMFKAWRSFRSFDRTRDLKPWLFKIVANECRRQ